MSVFLLLPAAVLTSACDRGEAAAENEVPSVVVTQWNDSTELFLEYPHPVAGAATGNWAIHLSDMSTFLPITEGTLTVRFLRNGGEAKRYTVEAPARAGIFLLDPVIDQPGEYEVEIALVGPQAKSLHTLPRVRVWAGRDEIPPAEEEGGAGIAFLKEQQWQIPFAVRPAREREVHRAVSAPGELVAPDGALAKVSAPTSGIAPAAANRSAPSPGQAVRAGDVLALLDPTSGEGGYARARGAVERLEREVARAERLWDAGAISARRLQEARHDLEIARAELRGMGGGDGGGDGDGDFRLRVRAPISGVVAQRSFVPGGRIEAGEPLFTIVDPSTLWLRVHLPPAAAASLPRDARASFTVDGVPHPFATSRLVSVGSTVDPGTRTVPAVFAVENPDATLLVGQYARAVVPVGGTVSGVAIPHGAIVDDNGTPVAYVQTGGETFERRVLALGETDAAHTRVLEGIRPGEMVVTTGAYQVRLSSMSGDEFAGGHAH
ncbi:MAG: efflux RND transporter periplasmic adaptor subunit [Gemmatimonadota bacterium]|nr:efflux RND transporter periplasmic adaptor subunit [Gemmatimonadota bacterium]